MTLSMVPSIASPGKEHGHPVSAVLHCSACSKWRFWDETGSHWDKMLWPDCSHRLAADAGVESRVKRLAICWLRRSAWGYCHPCLLHATWETSVKVSYGRNCWLHNVLPPTPNFCTKEFFSHDIFIFMVEISIRIHSSNHKWDLHLGFGVTHVGKTQHLSKQKQG